MAETLLSVSEVLLFGRVMTDMAITFSSPARSIDPDQCAVPPRPGRSAGLNAMLEDQLSVGAEPRTGVDPDEAANFTPRFARIYGFSYEGGYYDLDAPDHHGGSWPWHSRRIHRHGSPRIPCAGYAGPDRRCRGGVHSFADDIHVWSYDKADFSIRLDTLSGTIEDILLDIEIGAGVGPVSGGKVAGGKVAGGKVAGGKVAGGKVAGGKVAGGKVAGGKVAGGKVSGD